MSENDKELLDGVLAAGGGGDEVAVGLQDVC